MPSNQEIILKFSCCDKPGIVAAVATFINQQGYNIQESAQFEDRDKKQFFMRCVFHNCNDTHRTLELLKSKFNSIAEHYAMQWEMYDRSHYPKVLIAVSKWGHCLGNLLSRWKQGTLPADIVGVVSNHDDMRAVSQWYGVPYYHFPMTAQTKSQQEAQIVDLMDELNVDLLVLARYMQILSDKLCKSLVGRAINIHHSFLPGFKGAKPYHQAHTRGVKLIGATAHYVTSDLDEGPIIEQAVERVKHSDSPEELVEIGRDIESIVLSRAVRWHVEQRVLLNGNRTVVFQS
jgi:formyltetrahydrofolate deformylase